MGRTAYHRAYYWKRLESRRATARRCRAAWRHRQRVIKALCEGLEEAKTQNPDLFRGRGFTWLTGEAYTPRGDRKWAYGKGLLYPRQLSIPSAILVGETTRRMSLNPDRGSGPLDAQHIVRKREPHRVISAKVAHSRMAPKVISLRDSCRRTPSTPRRIHQRS